MREFLTQNIHPVRYGGGGGGVPVHEPPSPHATAPTPSALRPIVIEKRIMHFAQNVLNQFRHSLLTPRIMTEFLRWFPHARTILFFFICV